MDQSLYFVVIELSICSSLYLNVTGAMHEADDNNSIRSTWSFSQLVSQKHAVVNNYHRACCNWQVSNSVKRDRLRFWGSGLNLLK